MTWRLLSLLALATPLLQPASAQDRAHAKLPSSYGNYGDNGLPFFGQTLDARHLGEGWPADNLTPRGLILHLGDGIHGCFDLDLLRISLIWRERGPGDYLSMNGMAPGSYRQPHRKAPAGQQKLPRPIGTPLLASGLHPGAAVGPDPAFRDPRAPAIDEDEPGLGPLAPETGRWLGLHLGQAGPVLNYEIGGIRVAERWHISRNPEGQPSDFLRTFRVGPHQEILTFPLHPSPPVSIEPSGVTREWTFRYSLGGKPSNPMRSTPPQMPLRTNPPARLWKESVRLSVPSKGTSFNAPFIREEVPLPLPNPWKRNVRPSDFDFFPDGRLAMVTFDGDVWVSETFQERQEQVIWRRFAGGLHEPMGLRVVQGQIVIFDRNGLVRLHDRDGNGEADHYENFCSLPAQTAETREFAMGFEKKPGGGFYIAKGGQVHGPRGKLNGTIVEISADGKSVQTIATGLRQPFLGVDPVSGTLTASDQQGHWVPATPIHTITPGSYYGFQPVRLGPGANDGRTITEPPLWIPHFVNQSGARQVWIRNAKMGALNDCLVHIGYNQPAIFRIYLDEAGAQGAVAPLLGDFPTGLLSGRVNPADGLLYVGGLNLWGSTGKKVQGLYRIRPTGDPSYLPRTIRAYREGVVLSFNRPLDHDHATTIAHYTIDRWNYRRTPKYGSGHFKPDGAPGQEPLAVSCLYISEDHHSVFLGIPGMKPVHTLRISFRPAPGVSHTVCLSMKDLTPVGLTELGFEETTVDLTPGTSRTGSPRIPPTARRGRQIATRYGCLACHSTDSTSKVTEEPSLVVGPTWKGLFGSERTFSDGSTGKADRAYLRESILQPARRVTRGFETKGTGVGMPSYLGVLNDEQVDSLILYLRSLQ